MTFVSVTGSNRTGYSAVVFAQVEDERSVSLCQRRHDGFARARSARRHPRATLPARVSISTSSVRAIDQSRLAGRMRRWTCMDCPRRCPFRRLAAGRSSSTARAMSTSDRARMWRGRGVSERFVSRRRPTWIARSSMADDERSPRRDSRGVDAVAVACQVLR